MVFMAGSATPAEVEKFSLKKGDVLVTKDSEFWKDIAVPALVLEDMRGVLCGNHLAMIRPDLRVFDDRYLFRLFCSEMLELSVQNLCEWGNPFRFAIFGNRRRSNLAASY